MIFSLAGSVSLDRINPNAIIERFEESNSSAQYAEVDSIMELDKLIEEKFLAQSCIITIKDRGMLLRRPIYSNQDRKDNRILFDTVNNRMLVEISHASVGEDDQMGIPTTLIEEVVNAMQPEKKDYGFFKTIAFESVDQDWFRATAFRDQQLAKLNGTSEQIWHLSRLAFLKRYLTESHLVSDFSSYIGQTESFEDLLQRKLHHRGIWYTFDEVAEFFPGAKEKYAAVYAKLKTLGENIKTLRDEQSLIFESLQN